MKGDIYMSKLTVKKEDFIFNDLDRVWDELKKGKYVIGADHCLNKRGLPDFRLENVFHYANGLFGQFKIKNVPDSKQYELYGDMATWYDGPNAIHEHRKIWGKFMEESYDVFIVDNHGNLDTKHIKPGDSFVPDIFN